MRITCVNYVSTSAKYNGRAEWQSVRAAPLYAFFFNFKRPPVTSIILTLPRSLLTNKIKVGFVANPSSIRYQSFVGRVSSNSNNPRPTAQPALRSPERSQSVNLPIFIS